MMKILLPLLFLAIAGVAATVPSISLRNQFGEVSNNFIIGGSSQVSAKFIVDNTQAAGVRSLSSLNGPDVISAVYMNTTVTPSVGNPNPSPGYLVIQLAQPYQLYEASSDTIGNPPSGSLVNVTAGLSQGKPYTIYSTGTTTSAQWQALGLPSNLTPAPSEAFIAITGTPGVGTGQVALASAAGALIHHLELIGSPSLMVNTANATGGQLIFATMGPTSSGVTTFVPTAPPNGTVLQINLVLAPVAGSPL